METRDVHNDIHTEGVKIGDTKKQASKIGKELFRFERYFFLDFLFFIHIIAQIVTLVGYLSVVFSTRDVLKILGGIVLYPIVFFAIRFIFEMWSVLFSINKNLVDIKRK